LINGKEKREVNILHIVKKDLDETANKIIEVHKKANKVTVAGLADTSADKLLELIESHDKLIMW
jgi:hypothetical protein